VALEPDPVRVLGFDLESDGLIDEMTTIHSLVVTDFSTGERLSASSQNGRVEEALRLLMEADLCVGHNVIAYDIPAIQKLYPRFIPRKDQVFDTLVAARLIWPNIGDTDWSRIRAGKTQMPGSLAGTHKLEAWGYRVNLWKGDYAAIKTAELIEAHRASGLDKPTAEELRAWVWGSWSQEMQDYCEQDVEVTLALYRLILSKNYSQRALDLEHEVAWIIAEQQRNGFGFDVAAAEALLAELIAERATLQDELSGLYKPWFAPDGPTKKWAKTMKMKTGETRLAGAERQPIKLVVFNPTSRDHIADRLQKVHGWVPTEFTDGGKPKVDETILTSLPWPEARQLARYFQVNKLIGQLAEGDRSWLNYVKNGRIHGSVNPNGAVTGRATHSHPNVAQVPSGKTYRGGDARKLFTPLSPDDVQIGCDASGLELRMLGHFMARFDGGAYARIVVDGDVHWENVLALGLVEQGTVRVTDGDHSGAEFKLHAVFRDGAKTFIYAFLYGAGGEKIGTIIFEMGISQEEKDLGGSIRKKYFKGARKPAASDLKRVGNRLKKTFLAQTPALRSLIKGVTDAANAKGTLVGLDGRILHVRSPHAALNTLLQSAGALVCKRWLVEFHALLAEHGLTDRVRQMAWVHDEVQLSVHKSLINEDGKTSIVGELCVEAVRRAGRYFNLRVPLDGAYQVGANWKDCH